MKRVWYLFWRLGHLVAVCGLVVVWVISVSAAKSRTHPVSLFPRLQAGQILAYQIRYRSEKIIRTQSNIRSASPDNSTTDDLSAQLRLQILDVQTRASRAVIRARGTLQMIASDPLAVMPNGDPPAKQGSDSSPRALEFTILPDGRLDQVTGVDAMTAEQTEAWQEWSARFLLALGSPSSIALSQKWTSVEAEKSAAPIAGLRWVRVSTYVGNESCHGVSSSSPAGAAADAEPETCAVVLTNATLRQNSKPRDATPEDFRLHDLRTSGTASGANRIISFISIRTGLLVRATEEASQQMDATIVKADGSNRVRYDVQAKSRSEVVMISDPAPNNPQ